MTKSKHTDHSQSASRLKVLSFNPNSIGKNPKRGEIFQLLRNKQADIIFLSDTRLNKDVESLAREQWGGKAYFASFSSQARGVAILISKNLPVVIYDESVY